MVTDYLNSRDDRDKFNYFRIVDAHNQKRFVVTYGVFGSVQEAVGAAKVVNFNLPKEVKAFPEEFKMYAPQMDEYEIAPPLRDVGKTAAREVKLNATPKLLPAPKANVERQPQAATPTAAEPKRVAPKTSIEKSVNPQETLSIQEGKVIAESNSNDSNATRSEPKVINSKNDNADVKPKQTHSKPSEEKPKSKDASKDSMGELINQKSQAN